MTLFQSPFHYVAVRDVIPADDILEQQNERVTSDAALVQLPRVEQDVGDDEHDESGVGHVRNVKHVHHNFAQLLQVVPAGLAERQKLISETWPS